MVLNTWYQDAQQNPPDQDDLIEMADGSGLTFPVLSDADGEVYSRWPGLPSITLLAPGLEVVSSGSRVPMDEDIEAVLPGVDFSSDGADVELED